MTTEELIEELKRYPGYTVYIAGAPDKPLTELIPTDHPGAIESGQRLKRVVLIGRAKGE